MQRTCHFCGRVEENDIATFCTECGQQFSILPKLRLKSRIAAVISYFTILGVAIFFSLFRNNVVQSCKINL